MFVAAGVAYVYVSGDAQNKKSSTSLPIAPAPNLALPKPRKPGPNVPASVSIDALTSPVAAGNNSSITINTVPTSACEISVTYDNVPSKDSGLAPKVADDYGKITWSWKVDSQAPAGTWPVKVTCIYNKRSAVVIGNLQVTR